MGKGRLRRAHRGALPKSTRRHLGLIMSAAFSPIMIVGALVLPPIREAH
jgi:hypothetical protein